MSKYTPPPPYQKGTIQAIYPPVELCGATHSPNKLFKNITIEQLQVLDYSNWEHNSERKNCKCGKRFGMFLGADRHHCRLCGKLACKSCLNRYPKNIVQTGIDTRNSNLEYLKQIWFVGCECSHSLLRYDSWLYACGDCEELIKLKLGEYYTPTDSGTIMNNARRLWSEFEKTTNF